MLTTSAASSRVVIQENKSFAFEKNVNCLSVTLARSRSTRNNERKVGKCNQQTPQKTLLSKQTVRHGRKRVLVPDLRHSFIPAEIVTIDEDRSEALVEIVYPSTWESSTTVAKANEKKCELEPSTQHWIALKNLYYQNSSHQSDMRRLVHLNPATMLQNLKERHYEGLPYTDCLSVLVAMNPFIVPPDMYNSYNENLYAEQLVWKRRLSSEAYYRMAVSPLQGEGIVQNQTILVSGESGAGKSETVKLLLSHLAVIENTRDTDFVDKAAKGRCGPSITVQRILESSPILEAFGNAQTVRNKNSSRFGKFIQLKFDIESGVLTDPPLCRMKGSQCVTYLLEKSRVVSHTHGERSYHVFYQLLAASTTFLKRIWSSPVSLSSFRYLAGDGEDVNELQETRSSWEDTFSALNTFGFSGEDLIELMRALAVVLQLGNMEFSLDDKSGEEKTVVTTTKEIDELSAMVGISSDQLERSLTVRIMKTAFDEVAVNLRPAAARDACDALAKEIYSRIFDLLVSRINNLTECSSRDEDCLTGTISILDIFGFEKFEVNRFEQLCINYANERLQFQYIQNFCVVPDEFKGLGTDKFDLATIDNGNVLLLLDGKNGILDLLNEECITPNGSDERYVKTLKRVHGRHKHFVDERLHQKTEFGVRHFAGQVTYESSNFLERNNDNLPHGLMQCIADSTNVIIGKEFRQLLIERESKAKATNPGGNRRKKAHTTVVQKFRSQLQQLMEDMKGTDTRYIRCIKPNEKMTPRVTDQFNTLRQLKCAGLVAAIDVARFRDMQIDGLVKIKAAIAIQALYRRVKARKLVGVLHRARLVVCIQAQARQYLAMKRVVQMRQGRASRVIQCCARQRQARQRVNRKRINRACLRIQCLFRKNIAVEAARARRTLHAAVVIQSHARRKWAIRQRERMSIERASATRIQCQVRRHKWSTYFTAMRREWAATRIQCCFRRRKATIRVIRVRSARSSALIIQSHIRKLRARRTLKLLREQNAATKIQAQVRRMMAVSVTKQKREYQAVVMIQRNYRNHRAVLHFISVRKSTISIQTYFRRWSAMRIFDGKRKEAAALCIETTFRRWTAMRLVARFAHQQSAASLIQRNVRRNQSKEVVRQIRRNNAACVIQAQSRRRRNAKINAAIIIQQNYGTYTIRRKTRTERSARLIQTRVRMRNAAKLVLILRQDCAARSLQMFWRRRLQSRTESALVIQNLWKVYIQRKRWRMNGAAKLIQRLVRYRLEQKAMAAIVVQRWWIFCKAEKTLSDSFQDLYQAISLVEADHATSTGNSPKIPHVPVRPRTSRRRRRKRFRGAWRRLQPWLSCYSNEAAIVERSHCEQRPQVEEVMMDAIGHIDLSYGSGY